MALNNFFFNNTDWSSNLTYDYGNGSSRNWTDPLPYDQTPADLRQYLLIFRLVLLGIGTFDTVLLLAVYLKCTGIFTSCLGVYVANFSSAALIDMINLAI